MLISKKRLLYLIATFSYIDLLFLPYFQLIIVPFSLPLICLGVGLLDQALFPPKTKRLFFAIVLLMCTSVMIGFLLPSSAPYALENTKRIVQFLTSFLYLIFFFSVSLYMTIENTLKNISVYFVIYFLFLNVQFIFDPALINSIMTSIYGRLVTSEDIVMEHFRFSYMFSDPNTAGYFVLIAVMPWLFFYRKFFVKLILFTICLIITMFVQSRGALVGAILAFIFSSIPRRWLVLRFRPSDISNFAKGFVFAVIIGAIGVSLIISQFGELEIFESGLERVSEAESYRSGGSRFEIWTIYLSNLIPLPLGRGYQFDVSFGYGQFYPHSDILRFLFSYGIIATILFLILFFRTSWKFPLLLMPALVALAINSLIDEQKMFALFLATLGVLIGIQYRVTSVIPGGVDNNMPTLQNDTT